MACNSFLEELVARLEHGPALHLDDLLWLPAENAPIPES